MDEYTVLSYVTKQGRTPFDDWYDGLDAQAARRVYEALIRMEEGNLGDTKSVGKGVMERRMHQRPGYRIYFGIDGKKLVILLTGGTKKRQSRDIAQAQVFWADYKKRKEIEDAPHSRFQGNGKKAG